MYCIPVCIYLCTDFALLLALQLLLLLLLALTPAQLLAAPIDDCQLALDAIVGLAQILYLFAQYQYTLLRAERGIYTIYIYI